MRRMYTLYWSPTGANMAAHAALIEIGAPYELKLVDIDKGEHRSESYRRIQPHGRVPALRDGDLVMYESAAILLYLADRNPEARLAPELNSPERGLFLQWLMHMTNTVQEHQMHWFHPDFYIDGAELQAALKAHARGRIEESFRYFDGVLARRGPYLLGERFSAADLFFYMLAFWTRRMPRPAMTFASVARLVRLVHARPAVAQMMREEGIVFEIAT
jgi:glutathione S-transferase